MCLTAWNYKAGSLLYRNILTMSRRHADRIASYWLSRLRDSPPPKRLNYIYLVNDIVQNARARKRSEFPDAFSPLMAEAVQTAYRSSTPDIQNKIRRVIEVWRTRNVFEGPIQDAIEARLEDIDKAKGTGKKTLMGNSLFNTSSGSGMPKELEILGPLQVAVTKSTISARPSIDAANTEYQKLNDPDITLPSPPVHAARLSALMKSLANAESAVAESVKARKALIEGLEKILETNRSALAKDETTYLDLSTRKTSTEARKRDVEDGIMRGLSAENSPANGIGGAADRPDGPEPERPEFEAFTPDATTPIGSPRPNPQEQERQINTVDVQSILAGMSGGTARVRPAGGQGLNGMSAKRRKMSHEDAIVPDLGDLDEDVDELLRQESAKVT
jgi:regulator of Ty1 transposition protein 103